MMRSSLHIRTTKVILSAACFVLVLLSFQMPNAFAQDNDPFWDERQDFCPSPRGTLRGCYIDSTLKTNGLIVGKACVYFPCDRQSQVKICYRAAGVVRCDGVGAEHRPWIPKVGGRNCYGGCIIKQCEDAQRIIRENHADYELAVMKVVSEEFRKHRKWMRKTFFKKHILKAMMQMTNQLSAVAMSQVMSIGQFLDAKVQMETQREFNKLKIQAHNDYRPSEDFCYFGTNVRALGASDEISAIVPAAMSAIQMKRHLRKTKLPKKPYSVDADKKRRWQKFKEVYCDPKDNNFLQGAKNQETGLKLVCGDQAPNAARTNIDIDYTRLMDIPRTLDIAYRDNSDPATADEEDVLSLSRNLYGHDVLTDVMAEKTMDLANQQQIYMDLRSIAAKRNVAENSFNSIAALKAKGSSSSFKYMSKILEDMGVSQQDARKLLGSNPSYYAQLEVLSKKIYQNPKFYIDLYDTPANVKRKYAAMLAIERMLDNALIQTQQRQEMLTSVLLSSELRNKYKQVERNLGSFK